MGSNLQQIQNPNEPSLKDLLDLFEKDLLLKFNCHHVGTVQSFAPNTIVASSTTPRVSGQTATAIINYPKTYFKMNTSGVYAPVQVNYPTLIDSPVIFLGGGNSAMTFPIAAGDECLVLFNDRNMDNWFTGGMGAAVATPRLHAFADAIIIVGLRSLRNSLINFDPQRAVMRGGAARAGVNPTNNKVLITNQAPTLAGENLTYTETLNTYLNTLLTALQVFMTATSTATLAPQIAAAAAAFGISATTAATQIAGLLE